MRVDQVRPGLVDDQGLEDCLVDQLLVVEEEAVDVGCVEFFEEGVG